MTLCDNDMTDIVLTSMLKRLSSNIRNKVVNINGSLSRAMGHKSKKYENITNIIFSIKLILSLLNLILFPDHIKNPVEGDQLRHRQQMKKGAEFIKKVKSLIHLDVRDLSHWTKVVHVLDLHISPMTEDENIMISHQQVHIEKTQKIKNESDIHHQVVVATAVVIVQHPVQNL